MARQRPLVPWWAWLAALAAVAVVVLTLPKSLRSIDPIERAYWQWAEQHADDPDTIELVSIKGPRQCPQGPLYEIRTRQMFLGSKTLRRECLVIDANGAKRPGPAIRHRFEWYGLDSFAEM